MHMYTHMRIHTHNTMCIFISIIHNKKIKVGFKKNIKYGGFIAVQLEQTIKVIN